MASALIVVRPCGNMSRRLVEPEDTAFNRLREEDLSFQWM